MYKVILVNEPLDNKENIARNLHFISNNYDFLSSDLYGNKDLRFVEYRLNQRLEDLDSDLIISFDNEKKGLAEKILSKSKELKFNTLTINGDLASAQEAELIAKKIKLTYRI